MKKAVIVGKRRAEVIDVPNPHAKEDWAVVKVHVAPMCAEYKQFVSGERSEHLGHEAAGVVVEVAQPGLVKVGDRVVAMPLYGCGQCELCASGEYIHCQSKVDFAEFHGSREGSSTMGQYLLKPDWLLVPIPHGMSYAHASMACCGLGPTFGAMERIGVDAFDTVLLTGLGPVGLGGIVNARYRGATVIGVESNPWRAALAMELGAQAVVDPSDRDVADRILELSNGRGPDKAVDCSGAPEAHRLCIDTLRRKGNMAFVGETRSETPIVASRDMIRKGITLVGSWHYNLADAHKLMRIIARSGPALDRLISHTFPLSQVQRAWEVQASGQCAKVLLAPWEGAE